MTAAPMTVAPTASTAKTVLSVKDLNVVFSGFKALKGVNLEVYDGEILTIIGDCPYGRWPKVSKPKRLQRADGF